MLTIKEIILHYKKKLPYVEYFYPLYLCLTLLAFILSGANWFIIDGSWSDTSIHPILSLLFVMIFPILVFFFLADMINRCHLDQIESNKSSYLVYSAYFYLFYSVVLFFFFLLSNSVIFDTSHDQYRPLVFWIFALFTPLVGGVIFYDFWIMKTYPKLNVSTNSLPESQIGKTDQSIKQLSYPPRINDDSQRYGFILLSILLLFYTIIGTLFLLASDFQMNSYNPWFDRGYSFLTFALSFIPVLFVFFANLAFGGLALYITIVRLVLKTKVKLYSWKYYALPFLFSLIIIFSFLVTPLVISWRIGELKQSYSQFLVENEVLESDSFSLYNQTSHVLGEFQFNVGMTYMLILSTKGAPLPSREFEIQISFNNVPSEVYFLPFETDWYFDYHLISPQRIKESFEIHLSGNPELYYYIIPSLRVFFLRWEANPPDLLNLTINCTIRLLGDFPHQNDIPTSIAFVKDRSSIIKKGYDESKTFNDIEDVYRFFIAIPAFIIFLNCVLPLLVQYFNQKSDRNNSSSKDSADIKCS